MVSLANIKVIGIGGVPVLAIVDVRLSINWVRHEAFNFVHELNVDVAVDGNRSKKNEKEHR